MTLKDQDAILNRWRDYFSDLLNLVDATPIQIYEEQVGEDIQITEADVNAVIKSFKTGKAPGARSRLFSRSLQLLGMCKDKQRGNYERGCFDIMSISLNRLLRFDAKVRVCVKKLRKKQLKKELLNGRKLR